MLQQVDQGLKQVDISAPSRFHLTLVDLHSHFSGRIDGGAGITLGEPRFNVSVSPSRTGFEIDCRITDPDDRAEAEGAIDAALKNISQQIGLPGARITVESPISSHAGLGSKTSLLLSVARGYTLLFGHDVATRELARLVGRGGTSSIGVESFNSGGLVIDCGHSFADKNNSFTTSSWTKGIKPGPLIGRYDLPQWPLLLVTPRARKIHGQLEQDLFAGVCPLPLEDVRTVCHVIMMMLIPAAIENDIETFGKGINIIQTCRWKAHQIECQSEVVSKIMEALTELGLCGVAMSSWGSSVLGIGPQLDDPKESERIRAEMVKLMDRYDGGSCAITYADNTGHVATKT